MILEEMDRTLETWWEISPKDLLDSRP